MYVKEMESIMCKHLQLSKVGDRTKSWNRESVILNGFDERIYFFLIKFSLISFLYTIHKVSLL
jgi:hypothetical protein